MQVFVPETLALDSQTLSITATCFQYHDFGRRPGLKFWWGNTGVGSSPTFGTELGSFLSTTRPPRHTPTRQERLETVQHLRKKRQEPVEICSLTGRFPHPEMAGSPPLAERYPDVP